MNNQSNLTKTKIKNGTLTLPISIRNSWKNKEVLILPEKDRLIVQPLEADWDRYEEKVRKGKRKISSNLINKATRWAKKQP